MAKIVDRTIRIRKFLAKNLANCEILPWQGYEDCCYDILAIKLPEKGRWFFGLFEYTRHEWIGEIKGQKEVRIFREHWEKYLDKIADLVDAFNEATNQNVIVVKTNKIT